MKGKFLKRLVEFYLDKLLSFSCDADSLFKNSEETKNVITEETLWNGLAGRISDPPLSCYTLLRGKFFTEKS